MLKGITRNAVGDQPENIYEKIVDLVTTYIKDTTAIVLHVIPASDDFTNSESMKISKKYDPMGKIFSDMASLCKHSSLK